LPVSIREVRVRADSAFFDPERVRFIEGKRAFYTIVARLTRPRKSRLSGLRYHPISSGVWAGEFPYCPLRGLGPRRFVVIRRPVPEVKDSQKSLDGWDEETVQAFVENPCTCVYCGFRATSYRAWCQLVLDHFIPKRVRGKHTSKNYVVSCYRCNQWKGRYDPGGGRYTYLPRGKKQREMLIEKAKAHIRASEERQGRHELYESIMRKTKEAKT
jgi:5-methylcytosine-specific restriction endonuclease McrA